MFLWGGVIGDRLITILKIVQGNKKTASYLIGFSSGFSTDSAGQVKDIKDFFQVLKTRLSTISQNHDLSLQHRCLQITRSFKVNLGNTRKLPILSLKKTCNNSVMPRGNVNS